MQYYHSCGTPLGRMLLASDGEALTGAWFWGQKYFPAGEVKDDEPSLTVFAQAERWLHSYFAGQNPGPPPPLHPEGTPFRQEVWAALSAIPYGQTVTYGELAARLAARRGIERLSAQAVGGAVGHNPISIFIPCHRVLGADGCLTGYAGGIERKAALLRLENIAFRE